MAAEPLGRRTKADHREVPLQRKLRQRQYLINLAEDEELDAFERDTFVAWLTEKDFAAEVGTDWERQRVVALNFSAPKYKLEGLGRHDGPASRRGLLNENFKKAFLATIDISENRLHDIDVLSRANGFTALTTIMARKNVIWRVDPELPTLLELNLARNELTLLPAFSGCPNLEILILSHNKLSGTFECFRGLKRLIRLDVAYNKYNFIPSDLSRSLDVLAQLPSLSNLRLYNNPFVACFKEYQVFVIRLMQGLQVLDDVKVTKALRRSVNEITLYTLDCYDDLFVKRQQQFLREEAEKNEKSDKNSRTGFPRLKVIIEKLEEVLEDPSTLNANVEVVRNHAVWRSRCVSERATGYSVEEYFWADLTPAQIESMVSHFIELTISIMERHDSVYGQLVETLGLLTCVANNKLGEKCMATLGRMMVRSRASTVAVTQTLHTIVVPTLKAFGEDDLHSGSSKTMILGLVELLKTKPISIAVAKAVEGLVPMVVQWFGAGQLFVGDGHIVKFLAYSTELTSNLRMPQAEVEDLASKCIAAIDNRSISENVSLRDLWLDVLKLGENLVQSSIEEIADKFQKEAIHLKVMSRGKSIEGFVLERRIEARTLAAILRFITTLMARRVEVLRDCCSAYHIVEVFCRILSQHYVDPLVLTAACRGLTLVLHDPPTYQQQIAFIIKELGKVTPLLWFLGEKKYPDLLHRSLLHQLGKEQPSSEEMQRINSMVEAPVLSQTCEVAADAILAIVELVEFFAEGIEEEDEVAAEQRQIVNDALDEAQREKVLLKLLVLENDDVKFAVMRCISKVPLKYIQPEEMGLIIKVLAATSNISEGCAEDCLALVVRQLAHLAGSSEKPGTTFRQQYAEVAIAEASELMYKNASRATYGGDAEERQKLHLSMSIVSFFVTCSRFPVLRDFLRSSRINTYFPTLLKSEEELHIPLLDDVAIESCWTGRSLENLVSCLSGERALNRFKKVALRVLCRIADILEGRTDGLMQIEGQGLLPEGAGVSCRDVARREADMWDLKQIEKAPRYLDNQEWEDRKRQIELFIAGGNLRNIIAFVSDYKIEDKMGRYKQHLAVGREKLHELEAIAAARKQKRETAELKRREEIDEQDINLEEKHRNRYDKVHGRPLLMSAIQCREDNADEEPYSLFSHRHAGLDWSGELFLDESAGIVSSAYSIAAILRMYHALITVPPSEECRAEAARELRQPRVPMQLLALMEDVPPLACHIASKFLRVMSHAIELNSGGKAEAVVPLELIYSLSLYTQKLAGMLFSALRLAKDLELGLPEQKLCKELARFLSTMIGAVPCYEFSDYDAAQRGGISSCIDWLVPPIVIKLVVSMVTYDLQMDHGGGLCKGISSGFVQRAYSKTGMRETASDFLSKLMVRCPQHKYDILEVFSVSSVFLNLMVRQSYLGELLTSVDLGSYGQHVETWLRDRFQQQVETRLRDQPQRSEVVVFLAQAVSTHGVRLLCVSTRKVYLLAPCEEQPAYMRSDASTRWEPSWEAALPRDPTVIWERDYNELDRIYRCYGTQMMAIEWKTAGEAVAQFEILVFYRSPDCEACISCLVRASGFLAPVVNDPTIRNEVMKKTGGKRVLVATVATHTAPKPSAAVLALGGARRGDKGPSPRLFVLTSQAVFEFSINMAAWQPPREDADVFFDADDFHLDDAASPTPSAPAAGEQVQLSQDRLLRVHARRLEAGSLWRRPDGGSAKYAPEAGPVLTPVGQPRDLPPQEVGFESSTEAVLSLKFHGEPLNIRFYDDSGREHWRRALAYYLARNEHAWERAI